MKPTSYTDFVYINTGGLTSALPGDGQRCAIIKENNVTILKFLLVERSKSMNESITVEERLPETDTMVSLTTVCDIIKKESWRLAIRSDQAQLLIKAIKRNVKQHK